MPSSTRQPVRSDRPTFRSPYPKRLGSLCCAVVAALAVVAAVPAQAALRYESTMVTATEGQKPMRTVSEAWIEGDKARIEFRESGNPVTPAGTYLITVDGGETIYVVNPEQKTYSELDLEQALATAGALMEGMGGMIDIEVQDLQVEKLAEEDGPTLHGYDTTHYRYRTSYTMVLRVMGMSRPSTVERVQDFWSTEKIDAAAFALFAQRAPRTGFEDIDELMEAEMSKVQGVPLKMEETAIVTGKKGKEQSRSQTSMEITEMESGVSVAASQFEVPEDYTRTALITGAEAGDDEKGSRNPFRGILGGGR